MAVFTQVSLEEVNRWLGAYDLGAATALQGIESGIENSNFFLSTAHHGAVSEYILTIFEKLTETELPFYLNLMGHLDAQGIPCPGPTKSRDGSVFQLLKGKPAAVVRRLSGKWVPDPSLAQISHVGAMLARMHLAGKDYAGFQPNPRGPAWWHATAPDVLAFLSADNQAVLKNELAHQDAHRHDALPRGPIHADLFRDNVLFDGDSLGGFIDFYFAGCDAWLFDVAVCVNDWCIMRDVTHLGVLLPEKVAAFVHAYADVRPFTSEERSAWPVMLRAAALRFWLSRLYDFYLPRASALLTPHDPTHFERVLKARIAELEAGQLPPLPSV